MIQNPMELYDEIMKVTKPEEISSWTSDLQCKVTPKTKEVVQRYAYKHLVTKFKRDEDMWYEIPYAYKPWWEGGYKNAKV